MPRIRARRGQEGSKSCAVTHKDTDIEYNRPKDSAVKHLGRSLRIRVRGVRGESTVVLKGREINSLKKVLARVGELSTASPEVSA